MNPDFNNFGTIDVRKFKATNGGRNRPKTFILSLGRGRINLSRAFFRAYKHTQYYRIAVNIGFNSIAIMPTKKQDPEAVRFSLNSRKNGYNSAYNKGLVKYLGDSVEGIDLITNRLVKIYANPANVSRRGVIFNVAEDFTHGKDRIVEKPYKPEPANAEGIE